ncbi:MAG: PPOX class F420-dependent oxidoreductase [Acidimicrobiales bacterium]
MIPADHHDLLHAANTALVTTLAADGSPQTSPIWFLFDGERVSFSTTAGRQKYRNLERDARVSFAVVDPARPMRYLEIRGVAELAADPAYEFRDRVAAHYGFGDGAAFDEPGARRIIITVNPTRVISR